MKFLIPVFLITLIYCTQKHPTIRKVNLIVNYPVVQVENNKIHHFNMLATTSIFYIDDYVVYKLAPVVSLGTNVPILGTEEYFVYRKNDSTGLLFHRLYDTSNVSLKKVDSLLYMRASTMKRENMIDDAAWKLIQSNKNEHELIEKWVPKLPSIDPNMIDTFVFVYRDDYGQFEYSFSQYMDSLKKMKMTEFIAKQRLKKSLDLALVYPERQYFFKLEKKSHSTIDTAIINLVSRFKGLQKNTHN